MFDKVLIFMGQMQSLEAYRHHLVDKPNPKIIDSGLQSQTDATIVNNQYESFSSNSIFKSAAEFYSLMDSKGVGQSIL